MTPSPTPTRMPSRRSLQPALPVDVQALVRCGHLIEVEPGCFRRATRTTDTAPSARELIDHCTDRIGAALLIGDAPTARLYHHAARAVTRAQDRAR